MHGAARRNGPAAAGTNDASAARAYRDLVVADARSRRVGVGGDAAAVMRDLRAVAEVREPVEHPRAVALRRRRSAGVPASTASRSSGANQNWTLRSTRSGMPSSGAMRANHGPAQIASRSRFDARAVGERHAHARVARIPARARARRSAARRRRPRRRAAARATPASGNTRAGDRLVHADLVVERRDHRERARAARPRRTSRARDPTAARARERAGDDRRLRRGRRTGRRSARAASCRCALRARPTARRRGAAAARSRAIRSTPGG